MLLFVIHVAFGDELFDELEAAVLARLERVHAGTGAGGGDGLSGCLRRLM